MIQAVDVNRLRDELGIGLLNHVHDLLLDKVQVLSIASRSTANDVVNLDVIFLLAKASTVHSVRELDEDRVLLHDTLDVLTTNTDDALMVLVWHVERNCSGHLLFDEVEAILSRLVLCTAHDDIEVVLVEAIEHNLYAAVAHDLVDLAVLLAADKLLVFVGELNLDTHVVLRLLHEWDIANHHQSSSHSIIRPVDMEVELLEADFGT